MISRWFLITLFTPAVVSAAAIQLDAPDGTCHLSMSATNPTGTFYIVADAVETSCVGCLTGAEFRVVGISNDWSTTVTANPPANLTIGNPLGNGAIIGFPGCYAQSTIVLYTVEISYLPGGVPPATTLHVDAHTTPSNPNFNCPAIFGDIGVIFCMTCANGGRLYINSPGDCAVSVKPVTWQEAKALYK